MRKKIKLVVTDIDGTLMPINGTLPIPIKETIKKMQTGGVKVVLATGRMFNAAFPVAQELMLNTPIICYQGAMIRDEKNIYFEQSVPKQTAAEIIQHIRSYNAHTNLYLRDRLIVENDDKYIKEYAGDRDLKYEVVPDLLDVVDDATKLLAIHENANTVTKIRDDMKIAYPNLNIVKSTDYYCEFVNPNADKGLAIQFLADKWDIQTDEILAIGDQDNDIRMLQVAGIGIAMGNGSENIKKIADHICPTVQEYGFQTAMNEFVL
ncbi:MAG: Cof-type HAD-IIB family hydrolase [bacterium]|nr:Cof-type HAD-IIB family hydrolase [bacterium]